MLLNRSNMAGCSEPCRCNARRSVATPVVTNKMCVGTGVLPLPRRRRRGFFNSLETGG